MNKRVLGKTNLLVSTIGAGCWGIGGAVNNLGMGAGWDNVDEKKALDGLVACVEGGIDIFDTANVYGLGKSERLLSLLWKDKVINRENVVIASKVGYFQGCAEHGYDVLNMKHQLEMSLQNLKTDYIDVYFLHHLDFGKDDCYLNEAVNLMYEFKRQGKIRYIGLRGPHRFSLLRKQNIVKDSNEYQKFINYCDIVNPDIIGIRYNMISPTFDKSETDIFEFAKNRNLGILTYKALGQGLLLDKYDPMSPPVFSDFDHRSRKRWFQKEGLTILREKLNKIKEYFNITSSKDLVEIAIAYCLYKESISSVLVGFKDRKQITESLTTKKTLSDTDIKFIQSNFKEINSKIGDFISFK